MSSPINPLDDSDPELERLIREEAYHLWQAEGEKHGRDADYWERARELVGMRLSGSTALLPNPATVPGADPSRDAVIEEASIQENLGEFPDRFSDQGEKSPSPQTRARRKSTAKKGGS